MTKSELTTAYSRGPGPRSVRDANGNVFEAPPDWSLLAPGDAALTRRVKCDGPHWVVQERKGRRMFSLGVWAPAATIERVRVELEAERSQPSFAKRQAAAAQRRDQTQANYVDEFHAAIRKFLAFHPQHAALAVQLADAVAAHATPVGSGTVARTKRIPIERRAEAAVIAWLRHQTTGYDSMKIPRIKGRRREVRRMLAQRSNELLARYRRSGTTNDDCPLSDALARARATT